MDEATDDPGTAPADAFAAVASETRVAILQTLWDADAPQSFSELRDAVGLRDSGQFNYHLGQLTDRFVRKTDDGYELTYAGRQVVGSIHSGVYTDAAVLEPLDVGECPDCGGTLRATYDQELVDVTCEDCEGTVTQFGAPPTLLEEFDREELGDAFSRWVLTLVRQADAGFCSECAGRMRPEVDREFGDEEGLLGAEYTCEVCGMDVRGILGAAVLDHPAVVTFHADHGIDLREDPLWAVPWLFDDHADVEREDPLRVRLTAEVDGDRLVLLLDGSLDVVAVDPDD